LAEWGFILFDWGDLKTFAFSGLSRKPAIDNNTAVLPEDPTVLSASIW
jgi:hypothetical protein